MSACWTAIVAASGRFAEPNLLSKWATWVATVLCPMSSRSAISALVRR